MSCSCVGFRLQSQWLKLKGTGSANEFGRIGRSCRVNLFHLAAGGRGLRSSIYVMRGRGLRIIFGRWSFLSPERVVTGTVASADTLEWAVVQASVSKQSLAQRAARGASRDGRVRRR